MNSITITRPDDWHLHLRDGAALAAVLPDTARRFARAIVMPNLKPPVTTVALAAAYRERILAALPAGMDFQPLMTLYLTDNTAPAEIDAAKASGFVHAVKLYPAGATTNSDAGVSDLKRCAATLARMEKLGLPLLVHGEVTDPAVDVFDREAVFIDTVLVPLLRDFPGLKLVLEHITTKNGIDFVNAGGANVAGTLTAHHLLLNRNAIFAGGIRPHHYCLPVLKRERIAGRWWRRRFRAVRNSSSAPIRRRMRRAPRKTACGCAGCYTANAGIELYAEAFDAGTR
jgi:dihydroorotase